MNRTLFVCMSLFAFSSLSAREIPSTEKTEEEVVFCNKPQGVTLAGTLSLPYKGFRGRTVVLVSGSGPQDRNEEVFGHKPFQVLADYLVEAGIGVLRYDDRGIGGSTGSFESATTYDFSLDAESAVEYLHGRKFKQVGMAGHSEGGAIVSMVAARNPDVAFLVLLAAPGIRGDSLLLLQQEAIARKAGLPEQVIRFQREANRRVFALLSGNPSPQDSRDTLIYVIRQIMGSDFPEEPFEDERMERQVEWQMERCMSPWMLYFLGFSPDSCLRAVQCPVLALNGGEDLQVLPEPNLEALSGALKAGGNRQVETEIMPGLNHLFQQCRTCTINEYAALEEAMNGRVLERVARWINSLK